MPNTIAENLQRLIDAKADIADAITAKGGTVNQGDGLEDFAADIATIPSGGGGSVSKKDVNFYDYDGTIVNSYTAAEFANLSALPANPTHTGLTAQGWNWTLAVAKTYVAKYSKLNIGQMYITSDGKTRYYFTIPKDTLTLELYLTLDDDTELDIDWGDGSEHTTWTNYDGDDSKSHEYSDGGRYTIAITVVNGGFTPSENRDYTNLQKVELGSGVTSIGSEAFISCYALTSLTIPDSVTDIGDNAFMECFALTSITIPNSVTDIGESAFGGCLSLSITIPNSVTNIGESAFDGCQPLSSITIPDSVTNIGDNAFTFCYSLTSITIPDSVTNIGDNAFMECYALTSITFVSTTPPELDGDVYLPTTCIIRVPQGTLSDYTSAANYPDPSSYIYEEY